MKENMRRISLLSLVTIVVVGLVGCPGMFGPQIQIGSVSIPVGGTGTIFISASLLPSGLLGIEVSGLAGNFLRFDPNVINITNIEGVTPFNMLGFNVDNTNGTAAFVAMANPTGPLITSGGIVKLTLQHVGGNVKRTKLNLEITNLVDGNGVKIQPVAIFGGFVDMD